MSLPVRCPASPLLALALVTLLVPAQVEAQGTDAPASPPAQAEAGAGTSPWSVGLQSSWPSYGASVKYDLSDRTQAQGVLGALGTVTSFGGRLMHDFRQEEKYDVYAFGAVGVWRYGYRSLGADYSETSVGLGGGAGFDFDLARVFDAEDTFPALFWSIELGLTFASFDNYSWSAFGLGAGLHFHF